MTELCFDNVVHIMRMLRAEGMLNKSLRTVCKLWHTAYAQVEFENPPDRANSGMTACLAATYLEDCEIVNGKRFCFHGNFYADHFMSSWFMREYARLIDFGSVLAVENAKKHGIDYKLMRVLYN